MFSCGETVVVLREILPVRRFVTQKMGTSVSAKEKIRDSVKGNLCIGAIYTEADDSERAFGQLSPERTFT